jgi:hypothetical protein
MVHAFAWALAGVVLGGVGGASLGGLVGLVLPPFEEPLVSPVLLLAASGGGIGGTIGFIVGGALGMRRAQREEEASSQR